MAKRFTDSGKWGDEWFRGLSLEARLSWIYLLDNCAFHGVWKTDYGTASYQLGFKVDQNILLKWFGNRIFFFDTDKLLIVKFFEFQYGESKDSWSAKVKAKQKLETLGFTFENNKLINPNTHTPTTVGDSGATVLIKVKGKDKGILGECEGNFDCSSGDEKTIKPSLADLEAVYQTYPLKEGKTKGLEKAKKEIKSFADLELLKKAIEKYKLNLKNNSWKKPKQFSTFMTDWRDCLAEDYGISTIPQAISGPQDDFLAMAGEFFSVVKNSSQYDNKAAELLGPEKFKIFCKIGRHTIGSMKDTDFERKTLARMIKEQMEILRRAA